MSGAKILVYGAGPLGSVFASRLHEGGSDVSLLARGQRLADLREHGIVLHDVLTGETSTTRVNLVERLAPDDAYELVLVIMRKNHALQILPVLAGNHCTPHILFLMNNAAGPNQLTEALGPKRVLIGFPATVGYREGHIVHCRAGTEDDELTIPLGEPDGRITERTLRVARILETAIGYKVEIRSDMDDWLKTHVALLFTSIVPALYACGLDNYRLARTRDAVVLAQRAIREGFAVLRALGVSITPTILLRLEWLPEPVLVAFLRRLAADWRMEIALAKHAGAARDEAQHLADEFLALASTTTVPTPAIDRLYPYFDPSTPQMPDGSAELPMRWGGLVLGATITAVSLAVLAQLLIRRRQRQQA